MGANLIIGSSHAILFAQAAGEMTATWEEASQSAIRVKTSSGAETDFLFTTNRPSFLELSQENGRVMGRFGPLIETVRAFNRAEDKVVFCVGGNEHNFRFMRAHPKPFDFHMDGRPCADPARQVVPLKEMQAVVGALLERTLTVTSMIAAQTPKAQRYYLPPPPPIASEAHLRAMPEVFDFTHGVEDAHVRLKVYHLYLEAVRAFCEKQGIRYLAPPPANQDEQGFLLEKYWYYATHANADYYAGVVADLGL